jgi:hypothetical protein
MVSFQGKNVPPPACSKHCFEIQKFIDKTWLYVNILEGCLNIPILYSFCRLCYERLSLVGQGIEWAERALKREEENPQVGNFNFFI